MIRLLGELWLVCNEKLTHPWDANAYLIAGKDPVLIDCGSTEGFPALKRRIEDFGYRLSDIRTVIATHGHWDHLSGLSLIRRESDARLYIHEADRAQVESGDYDLTSAFLYDKPFPPVAVDGLLHDGDVLDLGGFRMTVYHTPGHTPGSVCLWTEYHGTRLLIAGDTLWGCYSPRIRSNIDDWQASLDRLLDLEFDVMTIGHCPPTLIYDARRKVTEARKQLGVSYSPWFRPFYETFRY